MHMELIFHENCSVILMEDMNNLNFFFLLLGKKDLWPVSQESNWVMQDFNFKQLEEWLTYFH